MDTIFAQATAPGKAGVAVIRISGPDAPGGCARLIGSLPPARQFALRDVHALDGSRLDSALVAVFEEGASFTGEHVVELHLHGSIAIVQSVLRVLGDLDGFRPAEAGEFTRRALDNGRMDLTQVEALSDLIEAETEMQRQQAQAVLSGALSEKVGAWRRSLIEAGALIEATLDFADEEVPVDVTDDVMGRIDAVLTDLDVELAGAGAAERVRDGFEVAIMGPPNAGKSTLLNAIARRRVALTSDIAGTTRDVLEVRVDLGGLPVTLLDTAGLRETADPLETAGIDLARERAANADLRVWLDLGDGDASGMADIVLPAQDDDGGRNGISGKTGQGVSHLLGWIEASLADKVPQNRLLIRERHKTAMTSARDHLASARNIYMTTGDAELAAESLRAASRALAEIIGGIDLDDLLDDIFSRFCIGK